RAMGRLDAMLGRSLLDAPDVGSEAPDTNLWIDEERAASPEATRANETINAVIRVEEADS
ncbi:MAG TPA: hypothetical protein VF365_06980, partial [Candidatus Limnocylindria bacterium]